MIENVLTRCCCVGDTNAFWRLGVLVRGNLDGSFALVVKSINDDEQQLDVYGNPESVGPWMVLSFVMSATLSKMLEFPGSRREASLQCPKHNGKFIWMSDQVIKWLARKT